MSDEQKGEKKIEHTRWVRDSRGIFRLKTDRVSPAVFIARSRERDGWRNGARISKTTNGAKTND
jgi:hypothetical protein